MRSQMKKRMFKRIAISFLSVTLFLSSLTGCVNETETTEIVGDLSEINNSSNDDNSYDVLDKNRNFTDYEAFVYDQLFSEYSLIYDTFDASVTLPDGSEIYGIGYSNLSCYLESIDETKGYFPAGFISFDENTIISEGDLETGLEIKNLSYQNDDFSFVFAYKTEPYLEHCVYEGKYIQYGVDAFGRAIHKEENYSREVCDTSLGSLYSYDDFKYIYDTGFGNYSAISGGSLFREIDYSLIESEINRILDEQDSNFVSIDIDTTVRIAKEALNSYLLSLQEETFLGIRVEVLVDEVSKLDPKEFVRITPEGNVIIDIENEIPTEPTALAKWMVGISCGITVAGCVALNLFVPATTPLTGAVCGAAIDVFMQVVIENNSVENINWGKVAISATSGAVMAWACPLGAASVAQSLASKTGNEVLSKLAGYGVLTLSNAVVSGSTNAAFALIDKKTEDEVFDSFVVGAALGAVCTVAASALGEVAQAGMKALEKTHPENWFVKLSNGVSTFISNHQVKLFSEPVESILSPKTVYEATQEGMREYNTQVVLKAGKQGGSYNEVKSNSNGNYTEVHETPSYESTGTNLPREQSNGPSIKMTKEDHHNTASWGRSREAADYRNAQKALIEQGKYKEAIQMDINDIRNKFGNKYDEGIKQMIEYAKQIGWWN